MAVKRRRRIKLGDVYAIPLINGKFAFGRRFNDGAIAIYKHIGQSAEDIPLTEEYQFIVGVYDYVLKSDDWPLITNRPFGNEDDAWPPPACIIDPLNGDYSIYYKGEIRPSRRSECEGLEVAAVWGAEHIVDRIMGDDKWHKN